MCVCEGRQWLSTRGDDDDGGKVVKCWCLLSTYSVIGVIAAIFTLYKLAFCALLYFSLTFSVC